MQIQRIKDVTKFYNGYAFKSKNYTDAGEYIVRIGDIKQRGIDLSNAKRVDILKEKKDLSNYQIKQNSILLAMSGATTGKVSLYNLNQKAYLNQRVGMLVCENNILPKYLYYFLSNYSEKFLSSAIGAAVQNLSKSQIENTEIPVPSLQEQEKIVERIDKVFANIDKNQEEILNLKFLYFQMKDSFINKKLSNEKTQVLSSFSDLQYGYTPDKNSREKIQVPILRITDLQNNKVDWENVPNVNVSQETLDKFSLKKGDILFARTGGTLGKSYLFNEDKKAIFASYLIRVTNTKSDFNPKFLKYFFESTEYWKQVNHGTIGAAQPFFNGKKLGNLKIPYFNKDEQKLIIKKLDTLSDLIEKLNDLNMLKKNKYSYFQKSILSKEFSYE
jgi:type I restriction enzyme S subunit